VSSLVVSAAVVTFYILLTWCDCDIYLLNLLRIVIIFFFRRWWQTGGATWRRDGELHNCRIRGVVCCSLHHNHHRLQRAVEAIQAQWLVCHITWWCCL